MSALGWLLNLGFSGAGPIAVITGTVSDGVLENELVRGWQDVVITLANQDVAWVSGQAFNDARQAIIDGFDSAQSETQGWNAEVRDKASPTSVVRVTDQIVSIVWPASSGFSISANETITDIVPASATTAAVAITATPTFVVTADTQTGTEIVNTDSTTLVPINYEVDQKSGFRIYPWDVVRQWDGIYTRNKSNDPRHPQETLSSRSDKLIGSVAPELDDVFLSDGEVQASEL